MSDLKSDYERQPDPSSDSSAACAHMHWIVRSTDMIGQAFCPDCKRNIPIAAAINNSVKYMRESLEETRREFNKLYLSKDKEEDKNERTNL